jgi:hypothetical protein
VQRQRRGRAPARRLPRRRAPRAAARPSWFRGSKAPWPREVEHLVGGACSRAWRRRERRVVEAGPARSPRSGRARRSASRSLFHSASTSSRWMVRRAGRSSRAPRGAGPPAPRTPVRGPRGTARPASPPTASGTVERPVVEELPRDARERGVQAQSEPDPGPGRRRLVQAGAEQVPDDARETRRRTVRRRTPGSARARRSRAGAGAVPAAARRNASRSVTSGSPKGEDDPGGALASRRCEDPGTVPGAGRLEHEVEVPVADDRRHGFSPPSAGRGRGRVPCSGLARVGPDRSPGRPGGPSAVPPGSGDSMAGPLIGLLGNRTLPDAL